MARIENVNENGIRAVIITKTRIRRIIDVAMSAVMPTIWEIFWTRNWTTIGLISKFLNID